MASVFHWSTLLPRDQLLYTHVSCAVPSLRAITRDTRFQNGSDSDRAQCWHSLQDAREVCAGSLPRGAWRATALVWNHSRPLVFSGTPGNWDSPGMRPESLTGSWGRLLLAWFSVRQESLSATKAKSQAIQVGWEEQSLSPSEKTDPTLQEPTSNDDRSPLRPSEMLLVPDHLSQGSA